MLDINLFRAEKGGNLQIVLESQRKRFADEQVVQRVVELDEEWRNARYQLDRSRKEFNAINKEIGQHKKNQRDSTELEALGQTVKIAIEQLEARESELVDLRAAELLKIGNIVDDAAPISKDEANNVVVRLGSTAPRQDTGLHNHPDIMAMLDWVELNAGTQAAGSRGYYMMNEGVLLAHALTSYAIHFAARRGYAPVQTPYFLQQQSMAECAQLSQFDDELYKVSESADDAEPKYLIATSEQSMCALYRGQWLERSQLPRMHVAFSTCFRREAGSHGRDTSGLFRVHQFDKVEQFAVVSPDNGESSLVMERLMETAEEFYTSLGVPYRVVEIVSGALNLAASRKQDLEAWFPASRAYRELVSCSNCTDYQARRLGIRVRSPPAPQHSHGLKGSHLLTAASSSSSYAHLLNCTLTAVQRTLCCLVETHQTEDGVRVPQVLQRYLPPGMKDFVPYRHVIDAAGRLVVRAATKR